MVFLSLIKRNLRAAVSSADRAMENFFAKAELVGSKAVQTLMYLSDIQIPNEVHKPRKVKQRSPKIIPSPGQVVILPPKERTVDYEFIVRSYVVFLYREEKARKLQRHSTY